MRKTDARHRDAATPRHAAFDLCVECFSAGAELGPHRAWHAYRVVDNLSFPLFEASWGADEELLLLEAIERFGLDNWGGVANHVATKASAECKRHYYACYLECPTAPLPDTSGNVLLCAKSPAARRQQAAAGRSKAAVFTAAGTPEVKRVRRESSGAGSAAAAKAAIQAAAGSGHGTMSTADGASAAAAGCGSGATRTPVKAKPEEAPEAAPGAAHAGGAVSGAPAASRNGSGRDRRERKPDPRRQKPTGAPRRPVRDPLTGYHKKREEFDPEWNTYPESCIADMDPLSGTLVGGHGEDLSAAEAQDATQLALKRKVLRAQAVEVAEVARRKKFLAERGLLDLPKALAAERALSAGERAAAAGAKVFARFLSTDELADLAAAMAAEHALRARISQLKEYKSNGVCTAAEAEKYEVAKRQRLAEMAARSQRRAPVVLPPREVAQNTRGGAGAEVASQQAKPSGGGRTAAAGGGSTGGGGASAAQGISANGTAAAANGGAAAAEQQRQQPQQVPVASTALSPHAAYGAHVGLMPGASLLALREREVCTALRMPPAQYIAVRDAFLRAADRGKGFEEALDDAEASLGMSTAKLSMLYGLIHGVK